VGGQNSVFILRGKGNQLVEETEQLFDLFLWEIGVVTRSFHFEGINVLVASGYNVRQGTAAWVADWHPNSPIPMLFKLLNQNGFAVKTSLAPFLNVALNASFIHFIFTKYCQV